MSTDTTIDFNEIDKLFDQEPDTDTTTTDATDDTATASSGDTETAGDQPGEAEQTEGKKDILAADGEHLIPYQVLERTRAEAAELKARIKELEGRADGAPEELKEIADRVQALRERAKAAQVDYDDEEEAKRLTDLADTLEKAGAKVARANELERKEAERTAAQQRAEIDSAVAAIPEIAEVWHGERTPSNIAKFKAMEAAWNELAKTAEFQAKPLKAQFEAIRDTLGWKRAEAQPPPARPAKQPQRTLSDLPTGSDSVRPRKGGSQMTTNEMVRAGLNAKSLDDYLAELAD